MSTNQTPLIEECRTHCTSKERKASSIALYPSYKIESGGHWFPLPLYTSGTYNSKNLRYPLRRGKCWFPVEVNPFEISIEEASGKLRGVIVKRGRGCSSWIRFGEVSLRNLLKGVEACCREESLVCNKAWRKNGRAFKLERCANEDGRLFFAHKLCSPGLRFLPHSEGQSSPAVKRVLGDPEWIQLAEGSRLRKNS
ncbi:hypothetical protein CK203_109313 [Vitis vinifera]|uniref:Uncharacterized protein n=1 Tax=Vitis vinifera TaxID=29760 RepID=A0A438C4X6_VITVI|nr:hypothetical protein CK203_109313 [Vitis vinifera]